MGEGAMAGDRLTPKQMKFAASYVESGNASKAYRLHYDAKKMKPATVNRAAKALLDNPKIATRIRELQAAHRQRHDVTMDSLVDELEEARFVSLVFGQTAAAVAATMGKAKLHGLITDHLKLNGLEGLKRLSDEQLIERIRGAVAGIVGQAARSERKS